MKGKPSGFLFVFSGKVREKAPLPSVVLSMITCYALA